MNESLNSAARTVSIGLVVLILLCGGVGMWSSWQLRGALRHQAAASALLRNHMTADMMHDAVRSDVLSILASGDPATGISRSDAVDDLREHVATLKEAIAADTADTSSPDIVAVTRAIQGPMNGYIAAAEQIAGMPPGVKPPLQAFTQSFKMLEQKMAAAGDVIEQYATKTAGEADWLGGLAITLVFVVLVTSVASAFVAARKVRSHLVDPLVALASAMRDLAQGDHDTVIPAVERKDELGALAVAMVDFREQLKLADASKDYQANLIVDSIGSGLNALAAGDLTARITADLEPPFAALKGNFNEALDQICALIMAVGESADAIRMGSGEIALASEDLARRTEGNAASLEETSASLTLIDGRLKTSAQASTRTVERADQAIATVGGGRSVAEEAVQAMGRVSDSAKGIDSVIEGLDKIAFQTRVLAMNAAVEAGRAGDAGRGFAVVADLVSALAMRAEEEAKRARDQLTVTQTEVLTAVEAVQRVDKALADISGDVGQVHELLATMAADNQIQSSAITQISSAIGTMDQTTQQNAAMVEETTAAARNLTTEVASLTMRVSSFTVETGTDRSRNIADIAAHKSARPRQHMADLPSVWRTPMIGSAESGGV